MTIGCRARCTISCLLACRVCVCAREFVVGARSSDIQIHPAAPIANQRHYVCSNALAQSSAVRRTCLATLWEEVKHMTGTCGWYLATIRASVPSSVCTMMQAAFSLFVGLGSGVVVWWWWGGDEWTHRSYPKIPHECKRVVGFAAPFRAYRKAACTAEEAAAS